MCQAGLPGACREPRAAELGMAGGRVGNKKTENVTSLDYPALELGTEVFGVLGFIGVLRVGVTW